MPLLVYPLMGSVRLDLFIFIWWFKPYVQVCIEGKDYFCVLQVFYRVFWLINFVILIGDYLSSPRSGELADFTWGKVGPCNSRFTKGGIPEGEILKSGFRWPILGFVTCPCCTVVVTSQKRSTL